MANETEEILKNHLFFVVLFAIIAFDCWRLNKEAVKQ